MRLSAQGCVVPPELKYSRTACTLRFQFTGRLALNPYPLFLK